MHIISFFGHYGVPVFLFLSAYGLVLKYEKSADGNMLLTGREGLGCVTDFMKQHYKKLFKMMILGFVAFTMVDYNDASSASLCTIRYRGNAWYVQ